VERSGDDGSSYLGFRSSDYRRVLHRAEAAGLDTGRTDHLDDTSTSGYYDADLQAYTATEQTPYADPDVMLAACLRARDTGTVPEGTQPPTLALIPIVRDAGIPNNPGDMSAGDAGDGGRCLPRGPRRNRHPRRRYSFDLRLRRETTPTRGRGAASLEGGSGLHRPPPRAPCRLGDILHAVSQFI